MGDLHDLLYMLDLCICLETGFLFVELSWRDVLTCIQAAFVCVLSCRVTCLLSLSSFNSCKDTLAHAGFKWFRLHLACLYCLTYQIAQQSEQLCMSMWHCKQFWRVCKPELGLIFRL